MHIWQPFCLYSGVRWFAYHLCRHLWRPVIHYTLHRYAYWFYFYVLTYLRTYKCTWVEVKNCFISRVSHCVVVVVVVVFALLQFCAFKVVHQFACHVSGHKQICAEWQVACSSINAATPAAPATYTVVSRREPRL